MSNISGELNMDAYCLFLVVFVFGGSLFIFGDSSFETFVYHVIWDQNSHSNWVCIHQAKQGFHFHCHCHSSNSVLKLRK